MTARAPLLAIVGPTASGKTEASIAVAEELGAEIVSVDSMLVYRGMDVGTAKPSRADRQRVPHHLIDLVDPAEPFSVAEFQRHASAAIEDVRARGSVPLLVGGGGLYYRAVVDGLAFPGTVAATRRLLEAEALSLGAEGLHARLSEIDPSAAAKIAPGNLRRTVRALEVAAITGRPFSGYARAWNRYPRGVVRAAGIDLPRPILYARIERRVFDMLPGLISETRTLLERGFEGFLTSTQAIGYAEVVSYLRDAIDHDRLVADTVRRTKALARRQAAWLRRDPRIRWFPAEEPGADGLAGALTGYLGSSGRSPARAGGASPIP